MRNVYFKTLAFTALFYLSDLGMVNAEELKFNWPLPAHANVVSTKIEKGNKIVGTYELSARAISDAEIIVEFSNAKVLELNGQNAAEIKLPATTKALLNSIPSYLVSKQTGQVIRVVGFDYMVERLLSLISDKAEKKVVTAFFKSPQIANLLYAKTADTWNSMVGAWVGQNLTKGEPQRYSYKTRMGALEIPTVTTYLLEDFAEIPGAVKLSLTSEQQIPAEVLFNMVSAMLSSMPNSAAEIKKMRDAVDAGGVSGTKNIRITSIHLPKTLTPIEVLKEEQTKINIQGEVPKVRKNKSHLKFKWTQ
jgi:hypothetical protein